LTYTPAQCYIRSPRLGYGGLCMAGHIRTLQKCPGAREVSGPGLTCPPARLGPPGIHRLWWRQRIKIYTDPQGYPWTPARTEQLLSTIPASDRKGTFRPRRFLPPGNSRDSTLPTMPPPGWNAAERGGPPHRISRPTSGDQAVRNHYFTPFLTNRIFGISAKATSWTSWPSSRST